MKPYVNLLPVELQRYSLGKKMLRRWYLITASVLVLGILAIVPYQTAYKNLQLQIHDVLPIANRSFKVETELDKIRQNKQRIYSAHIQHRVMTGQYPPLAALAILGEFCLKHPHSIEISSFDYTNNRFPKREELPKDIIEPSESPQPTTTSTTSQPPADGLGIVVIQAKLTDPTLATALLGNLKASKLFKEVTLLNHNVDRKDDNYLSTIDLTCKF